MFLSFLNRFFPKPPKAECLASDTSVFADIAKECGGHFYAEYTLFVYDTSTLIDLLLFLPHRGLYFGEKISWRFEEIQDASLSRASKTAKKPSDTRFDSTESALRRKLTDVLSFDSTPCIRFAWLEHITQEQFDVLDPSFHTLLPKSRLVFADEPLSSIRAKLEYLAPCQSEPYSALKVLGSLNAHRLLLPSPDMPFGSFLSDEQHLFLDTVFDNTVTTLYGASGSGKSTLLLRKAVEEVLYDPKRKVLILTPTLLAGELLRNKLVVLMDYGAFTIALDAIVFATPKECDDLEKADIILCDDAYRMEPSFIERLKERRGDRWLLFSTLSEPDSLENTFFLLNRYRYTERVATLECSEGEALYNLLSELRKRLFDVPKHDIMVVLPKPDMLSFYKDAVDEYLGVNCRVIHSDFSLQYQNLDDVLLATADTISGIRIPHLFLIVPQNADYSYELSRASETATIISFPDPHGEYDAQNNQE